MNVIQTFYIDFVIAWIKNHVHNFFVEAIVIAGIAHMSRENSVNNFLFATALLSNHFELQRNWDSSISKFTGFVHLTISNKFSNPLSIIWIVLLVIYA